MRRRRAWADTRFAGTVLAVSATSKSDLLAGLVATETKTVSRILIDLLVYHRSSTVFADVENGIDIGIGVVSSEAFTLETLPDMDAVADYPQAGWVYVSTLMCYRAEASTGLVAYPAHFKADIRGQRKVDRGVLFMSILNTGIQGSETVGITGRVRALCLT